MAPWAMRAGGACRSKTVLDTAGVQRGARQVTFNGMDGPVADKTPDFVKALDIDHARDGEVMLAYAMNGTDLPLLNGFRCVSSCRAITGPIGSSTSTKSR